MTWAKILAGVVGLLNALAQWLAREQVKADGAAVQRDKDMRADNERIAEADRARDRVNGGGGVPAGQDPFNRDTRG